MHSGRKESFSLCLSVHVYLHLLSVKRLDKNISNNIFLFNLFYFWYLSGQPYNYLLALNREIAMELPKDIIEARNYLEQAEKERNPERKVDELKGGIELLEFYLEDNPDSSQELVTYITNLRRSHTRRLLSQLLALKKIEIETWLQYIVLIVVKLKEEVKYVTEQDPELNKNYKEFWNVWSDVFKEAMKEYSK